MAHKTAETPPEAQTVDTTNTHTDTNTRPKQALIQRTIEKTHKKTRSVDPKERRSEDKVQIRNKTRRAEMARSRAELDRSRTISFLVQDPDLATREINNLQFLGKEKDKKIARLEAQLASENVECWKALQAAQAVKTELEAQAKRLQHENNKLKELHKQESQKMLNEKIETESAQTVVIEELRTQLDNLKRHNRNNPTSPAAAQLAADLQKLKEDLDKKDSLILSMEKDCESTKSTLQALEQALRDKRDVEEHHVRLLKEYLNDLETTRQSYQTLQAKHKKLQEEYTKKEIHIESLKFLQMETDPEEFATNPNHPIQSEVVKEMEDKCAKLTTEVGQRENEILRLKATMKVHESTIQQHIIKVQELQEEADSTMVVSKKDLRDIVRDMVKELHPKNLNDNYIRQNRDNGSQKPSDNIDWSGIFKAGHKPDLDMLSTLCNKLKTKKPSNGDFWVAHNFETPNITWLKNSLKQTFNIGTQEQTAEVTDMFGNIIANKHLGWEINDHGAYLKLSPDDIIWKDLVPLIHVIKNRKSNSYPWYIGYKHKDSPSSRPFLYLQLRTVEDRPNPPGRRYAMKLGREGGYASYEPGMCYISFTLIKINAEKWSCPNPPYNSNNNENSGKQSNPNKKPHAQRKQNNSNNRWSKPSPRRSFRPRGQQFSSLDDPTCEAACVEHFHGSSPFLSQKGKKKGNKNSHRNRSKNRYAPLQSMNTD